MADDRDHRPVTIERSDAIDAAGALILTATDLRKQAKRRSNGGPRLASHRAWLRTWADQCDEAAARIQRVADEAM